MTRSITLTPDERAERRLVDRLRGRARTRGYLVRRAPARDAHRGDWLLVDASRNYVVRQTDSLEAIEAELAIV